MHADEVTELLMSELGRIEQDDLVAVVETLQIEPRKELRDWDYGSLGQQFPCWIVIEDRASNTCIACCEQGFGPEQPWGVLSVDGEEDLSMGMDSQWHSTLEAAVRNCSFWHGENPDEYVVA